MRSEQQQSSANNSASSANGGVDLKWRKNYVPYQEADADASA